MNHKTKPKGIPLDSEFGLDALTFGEAGRIVSPRTSAALVDALLAVRQAGPPDRGKLAALTDHLAPGRCSDAYLAWFDNLAAARGR